MVKESKQRIECFNCKRLFPLETMISGSLIRPPVAELILKRLPDWTPGKMLCPDCLHLFRSEYVEEPWRMRKASSHAWIERCSRVLKSKNPSRKISILPSKRI